MPDEDVKEAVMYMSEVLNVALQLCAECSNEVEALEDIRNAKLHYEEVLRAHGFLPALVDTPVDEGAGGRPMDLVSLADKMSSAPDAAVQESQ